MQTKIDYKQDFPLLNKLNITYLDSGATSQKPKCVIDACKLFYTKHNANPNRGAYTLSTDATVMYSCAREKVAKFINAADSKQIIFTKNATEALNLVAYSYGLNNLKKNDSVVLSIMEHHSSIVPWQKVTSVTGATLKYMYVDNDYNLTKKEIDEKIVLGTKVVVISTVSNVLGTINDVEYIVKRAHSMGAVVIVDASQSIAHTPLDVQALDADFAVFSGHKMYGPMGIGVLYGKLELLENMYPFLMGGDMIEYVYEDHTTFAPLPNKFEAGTQNVEGAYGLAKAIDYIESVGYKTIAKHENELYKYMLKKLHALKFVKVFNTASTHAASVVSFNIVGVHPHDTATVLNSLGVCVRAGNHCAQPLLRYLGVDSTVRASIAIYNSVEDIDKLIKALQFTYDKFKKYLKGN